jgi:hypothetical protein
MFNRNAYKIAQETMQRTNKSTNDFIAWALVNAKSIPEAFDTRAAGWVTAEAEIENAIADSNVSLTQELCEAYENRVLAYLHKWRKTLLVASL